MPTRATTRDRAGFHVDWFRVLADLQRGHCSNTDVADYLGVPRGTLRGWRDGSQPRHVDGERLVLLWCEIMGKPREDAPLIGKHDWRA